jgi:serine/threonine protein kinase
MLDWSETMRETTRLGKYQIETFLGKGAFAEVYKAVDTSLKRIVALKVLKAALIADEEAFARFVQEAQVLANLVHPQIAWVWDLGEADGRYFIAMRFVDGKPLDKVIAERGRLPWEEALKITGQIAGALQFAHAQGLVHRDVKPQNIMLGEKDGAVLTDFGLVKALHSSGMSSTTSLIGTPSYIAPEIWEGENASPASDQYAQACVVTEMLTGKVLFGGTTPAIMKKILLEPLSLPEDLPAGILAALRRALSKKAEERYASVEEFTAGLREAEKIAPILVQLEEKQPVESSPQVLGDKQELTESIPVLVQVEEKRPAEASLQADVEVKEPVEGALLVQMEEKTMPESPHQGEYEVQRSAESLLQIKSEVQETVKSNPEQVQEVKAENIQFVRRAEWANTGPTKAQETKANDLKIQKGQVEKIYDVALTFLLVLGIFGSLFTFMLAFSASISIVLTVLIITVIIWAVFFIVRASANN